MPPCLLGVDAGAGAFGGGPELFADLVDQVDEFLALGGVVGLLGFAGDLGGVPHELVDGGVGLEVVGLEEVGPEGPRGGA